MEEKQDFDTQELTKKLVFEPSKLEWVNFGEKHPEVDRWVLMWCNLGKIGANFFVTYRDASGHYDLPHPTKHYPGQAWAYLSLPQVNLELMEKSKEELRKVKTSKKKDAHKS